MKLFSSVAAFAAAALTWQVVVASTVKGLFMLALAALTVLLMRKQSASARHLVWLVAIIGLFLLPFLSLTLPKWRILPLAIARGPVAKESPAALVTEGSTATRPVPATGLPTEPPPFRPLALSSMEVEPASPTFAPKPEAKTSSLSASSSHSWSKFLPVAWTLGALFLIIRLAAGWIALLRLRQTSKVATEGTIATAVESVRRHLQMRGEVRVFLNEKRAMPMSWGVFGGKVLLPAEAEEWSENQLRAVLLHELGHLKRRDPLVHVFCQVVCALHWFNPLVWIAAWRLHVERERACDDLVLQSGVKASDYAQHLLDVVAGYRHRGLGSAGAVAMARRSRLEGRLVSIMSEQLNRQALTRRLVAATVVLGTALVLPFAMIQAQPPEEQPAQAPAEKSEAQPRVRTPESTLPTEDPLGLNQRIDDGRVVETEGEAGNPKAKAIPGRYPPGNYLGGDKPPADRKLEPAWGKAQNGLQAGVLVVPSKEKYALGDEIEIRSLVRNTSKENRNFSVREGLRGVPGLRAVDSRGVSSHAMALTIGGHPIFLHHLLEPGDEVEVNRVVLKFVGKGEKKGSAMFLEVIPGERYQATISLDLPEGGDMNQDLGSNLIPAKDEWKGRLESGGILFTISKGATGAADADRTRVLELLEELNKQKEEDLDDAELQKRIEMYERAFRLQSELGALFDDAGETTGDAAGIAQPPELDDVTIKPASDEVSAWIGDRKIWTFRLRSKVAGNPVMAGKDTVVVTDSSGRVVGLDARTGELKWEGKTIAGKANVGGEGDPSDELVATWAQLVEMRKQSEVVAERAYQEGRGSLDELGAARHALLEARIGHARVAGNAPKTLLALHEEQVDLLEQQEAHAKRLYKAGKSGVAEVQRAVSRVIESKIKLLELRKEIAQEAK